MIKAINVVMSDVGVNKSVTFNIELDGVTQIDSDSLPKVFTATVAAESAMAKVVQSILADYLTSVTAPSNPVDLADIEL